MNEKIKKKDGLQDLLQIYFCELEHEESCFGRLMKFEKLDWFTNFQLTHSVQGVFRLRVDDLIYLILLLLINIFFSVYNHLLTKDQVNPLQTLSSSFIQYNVMMWVGSTVWILFPHWYKVVALLGLYVLMPLLIVLAFMNLLPVDPIDPTTSFFDYVGYLLLPLLLMQLVIVYPLKEYIRSKIGSIYSIMFALSVIVLLFLWPVHEFVVEFIANLGAIQLTFINNNIAIIYCIWAIFLCFIYMYIHNSMVAPDHSRIRDVILLYLTEEEMTEAVRDPDARFIIRHYKFYYRFISFLIFSIFIGTETYFLYLMIGYVAAFNLFNMVMMAFMIVVSPLFLVLGTFIVNSTMPIKYLFVILSLVFLMPSASYPFISGTAYDDLSIIGLAVGPFTCLFWMVLKSIRVYQRILFLSSLAYLYLFFYIPTIVATLNMLKLFTTDLATQSLIQNGCIGVVASAVLIILLYLIIAGSISIYNFIKSHEKKVGTKDQVIDYEYDQEGQVNYIPYTINESFSLAGLTSANLIRSGYFFNSLLLIGCQVTSIYTFTEANSKPDGYFYSPTTKYVILAQFPMSLIFYFVLQIHIGSKPTGEVPKYLVVQLVALAVGGLACLGCSFIPMDNGYQIILRLTATSLIVSFGLIVGLTITKNANEHIHKFLSPVSAIFVWWLLIIPFIESIPVASVFIDQSLFGQFMYYVIAASTLLLILVVSVFTLIFNALLNRFEQEKKMKFITNELKLYFNLEGLEADDMVLHRMYQSYEYRDHKYMYYMRNGFPINMFEGEENKVVTMEEWKQLKESQKDKKGMSTMKKTVKEKPAVKRHCCLSFLDCLCGDDEDIEDKLQAVLQNNQTDSKQMEDMLPLLVYESVIKPTKEPKRFVNISNKNKAINVSTKSIVLKNLTKSNKKFKGDIFEQMKHNKSLRTEMWHKIFEFFSNNDYPPNKIIFTDLEVFVKTAGINANSNLIDKLYEQHAHEEWADMFSLDLEGFSLVIGDLCQELIEEADYDNKVDALLMEEVFPNLYSIKEFREFLEQFYKIHKFQRQDRHEIEQSPFNQYDKIKDGIKNKNREHSRLYENKKKLEREKKGFQGAVEKIKVEKTVSCRQKSKRNIISCFSCIFGCLDTTFMYIPRKIKQLLTKDKDSNKVARKRVKPWSVLSLQSVKLIQVSQKEYIAKDETEYHFRPTFNNIFPAVLKILDAYYFVSLSFSDPSINWFNTTNDINPNNGGALYEQYQVLFWVCTATTVIYLGMSIKGVRYINEGRFGITEAGLVAGFPHPMFFFTNIYKILSLLFSFVITTIFDTFDCTWFDPEPFVMYRDSSIQCLSVNHSVFIILAVVCLMIYYPITAYINPNLQFAQKSLDLKYKPSYLVIFFQCKLILVAANILLTSANQDRTLEIAYIGIILVILLILFIAVLTTKPCLIIWFNYIDALIFLIGIIVNGCGLAIYLTGQRIACLVAAPIGCVIAIVCTFLWIFCRHRVSVTNKVSTSNTSQLIEALSYRQKKEKKIVSKQNISTQQFLLT